MDAEHLRDNVTLHLGDCFYVMAEMEAGSVDAVVTDPPYGLNIEYKSYKDTIDNLQSIIDDILPLLRELSTRVVTFCGIKNMFLYPRPDWVGAITWNTTGSYGKYGVSQWQPILFYGEDIKGFGSVNGGVLKSDTIHISGGGDVGFMRGKTEKGHPCPKGVKMMRRIISRYTNPGDTILGMSLAHGGHLTHGAKVNFSGRIFHAVSYGVDAKTGLIDYDEIARLAREHKPRVIVGGFSAYSRVIDWTRFRAIADEVGAYLFVDMAHVAGLVAAGLYPSPVHIADVTTSTTHKTLRGPRGGLILARENAEIEKRLNSMIFPGTQGGPLMHVIAAKAVAFAEALTPEFHSYQQQVVKNAQAMADTLMGRGFKVVSGGTDNHLMLVDLIDRPVTGKEAEEALGHAHITVNKNAVPNDPRSPFVTSGVRLGTPAITTRGFGERETRLLAGFVCDILDRPQDEGVRDRVRREVQDLCLRFPVYDEGLVV